MNAILEILQICSNELAVDGQYYESIWTLDGQQVYDLNELSLNCKICLCSFLPMIGNMENVHMRKKVVH